MSKFFDLWGEEKEPITKEEIAEFKREQKLLFYEWEQDKIQAHIRDATGKEPPKAPPLPSAYQDNEPVKRPRPKRVRVKSQDIPF
jgi:hypothetical protein